MCVPPLLLADLTRYSGLSPGDLDPALSRHHIETMKAAYLKLRQLIDAGCVFVGHGLKTDFEMINVVVPPEQIIDTVNLFYLEGSRRISLRFLAWHVLGVQMSNRLADTHDSIEDAYAPCPPNDDDTRRVWRGVCLCVCSLPVHHACCASATRLCDRRTALALYNKYLELQSEGHVQDTINKLYDIGRETQWEVP